MTFDIPKTSTYCLGISDVVYDIHGNMIGRVGFHDYDGYLDIFDLREKVNQLSTDCKTSIYCLKTGYGYHLISFEILDGTKYQLWLNFSQLHFESDYLMDREHRVLRLSKKGRAMRPHFMFSYLNLNFSQQWSLAHVNHYINYGIIPRMLIRYEDVEFLETQAKLCVYKTKKLRGEAHE